jgi:hypothetical protein
MLSLDAVRDASVSLYAPTIEVMWCAAMLQVLSINKALPLQAHPPTHLATALHGAHPDVSDWACCLAVELFCMPHGGR